MGLGVHRRHTGLAARRDRQLHVRGAGPGRHPDEIAALARPILALYRLRVRVTPDTLADISQMYTTVRPDSRLLRHRADLAVRVRLERSEGGHHPHTWLMEVA